MTIKEFMDKYQNIKKELCLDGYYIPHICDKLYPVACKGITKNQFIRELYKYVDKYKKINFSLSYLALEKRKEFDKKCLTLKKI